MKSTEETMAQFYKRVVEDPEKDDFALDFPLTPPKVEILSEPCESCGA